MKRRHVLKLLCSLPCVAPFIAVREHRTHGYVDVDRAMAEGWYPLTVYVDGVEIEDCVAFHDREGWAEYYVTDLHDQHIYSAELDSAVTGRRYGHVTFTPNSGFKRPSSSVMSNT